MNPPGGSVSHQHEKLVEDRRRLHAEAERLCAEVRQKIEHLEWVVDSVRRQWQPDFFRPLHNAIRVMHGREPRHVASLAVRKIEQGKAVWSGIVEEFALEGAAGEDVCYAWKYGEDGQPRTFTLLKQPPVDSPQAAVQFYLLARKGLPATNMPA